MAIDQNSEAAPVDANDLVAVLCALTIEIVGAAKLGKGPEDALIDVAQGLAQHAEATTITSRRAIFDGLHRALIYTEHSGL